MEAMVSVCLSAVTHYVTHFQIKGFYHKNKGIGLNKFLGEIPFNLMKVHSQTSAHVQTQSLVSTLTQVEINGFDN